MKAPEEAGKHKGVRCGSLIGQMAELAKAGAADDVGEDSRNCSPGARDDRGKCEGGQRKDSGLRNKVEEERRDNCQRNRGLREQN